MVAKEIREEMGRYAVRGYVPSNASAAALLEMSNRWARAEARKNERQARSRAEKKAAPATSRTVSATRSLAQSIMSSINPSWDDLLDTTFRLPDGTEVTWGDASAEQHESSAESLIHSSASSLENAARHQQAAADIRAANSSSLRDLP